MLTGDKLTANGSLEKEKQTKKTPCLNSCRASLQSVRSRKPHWGWSLICETEEEKKLLTFRPLITSLSYVLYHYGIKILLFCSSVSDNIWNKHFRENQGFHHSHRDCNFTCLSIQHSNVLSL